LLLLLLRRFCLLEFCSSFSFFDHWYLSELFFYRWTQFCFLFLDVDVLSLTIFFSLSLLSFLRSLSLLFSFGKKRGKTNHGLSSHPSFCRLPCHPWFLSLPLPFSFFSFLSFLITETRMRSRIEHYSHSSQGFSCVIQEYSSSSTDASSVSLEHVFNLLEKNKNEWQSSRSLSPPVCMTILLASHLSCHDLSCGEGMTRRGKD
jgi:hypothetical protein